MKKRYLIMVFITILVIGIVFVPLDNVNKNLIILGKEKLMPEIVQETNDININIPESEHISLCPCFELSGNRYINEPSIIVTSEVNEFLSLYEKPGYWNQVIGTIPPDVDLEILDFYDRYFLVEYEGQKGYVHSAYTPFSGNSIFEQDQIVTNEDNVYTYADMMEALPQLVERYPEYLQLSSIGTSYWGQDIPVVILGNPDAEKHILIHAGIHAREHMTCYLAMELIEYYSYICSQDGILREEYLRAFENTAIHIVPMLNPDGVTISQLGIDGVPEEYKEEIMSIFWGDYRRYEYGGMNDYFIHWKANGRGVDLNRNFDYGWDITDSRSMPAALRYKGEAPHSEPETIAILDYTDKYDFQATISYHSHSSEIYFYTAQEEPLYSQALRFGEIVGESTKYPVIKSNYISKVLAGYKDYILMEYGIPSLTIEIGRSYSPVNPDQSSLIFTENRDVVLDCLEFIWNE